MKTTEIGRSGEDRATAFLHGKGYKIIDRNWKTRVCEVDIIAQKQKTLYFVEVKARKTTRYGAGIEYITPKKLQQMRFAAELWVQEYRWTGAYQLAAIGIDDGDITFVEDI